MNRSSLFAAGALLGILVACSSDDGVAGGRIGTDNTVKYTLVADGKPVVGARVSLWKPGVVPLPAATDALVDQELTDDSGRVVLTVPSELPKVDLQMRGTGIGALASDVAIQPGDTLLRRLQPAKTGTVNWLAGTSRACPVLACGAWIEGSDFVSVLPDTTDPVVWKEVPDGVLRPVLWFRDAKGVRLVRLPAANLAPSVAGVSLPVVLLSKQEIVDGLAIWTDGCTLRIPLVRVGGIPVCQ